MHVAVYGETCVVTTARHVAMRLPFAKNLTFPGFVAVTVMLKAIPLKMLEAKLPKETVVSAAVVAPLIVSPDVFMS